jgi:enoyl-CoA hydratase/carnithine racemase
MGAAESRVKVAMKDLGERGLVAEVTIDNPAKLNILNTPTMTEFVEALRRLAGEERLRAAILTGAGGRAFVGGADITEMAGLEPDSAEAFITRVHRCCAAVRDLPVPVIARIDGYVLGAGLELAAACDLRVASHRSVFGMPEVKVGIPSVVEAALLPALIGWGRTRELLLLGENIDAARAYEWGLVERVVATEQLDAAVEAWLTPLLAAGPRAVRLQKALIRKWEDETVSAAIASGIKSFREAWTTDEPRRMMAGFWKKRS